MQSIPLDPHPELANFQLDESKLAGRSGPLARSVEGQRLLEILKSRDAVCAVIGAIDADPDASPLPALHRYLVWHLGMIAADDEMKILAGRILRQIVEHLGGTHHPPKVIAVGGIFTSGSVYDLPTTQRGPMDGDVRRRAAERQLAQEPNSPWSLGTS
jgi:hypothetical protein